MIALVLECIDRIYLMKPLLCDYILDLFLYSSVKRSRKTIVYKSMNKFCYFNSV